MLNTAPYNTSVPQFRPSKEAPIFPYITKKYPCQETYAGKENHFQRLSWKIQQPDPNMVWTAVKLVLPLEMTFLSPEYDDPAVLTHVDVRTSTREAACNIALAETPMKAFRATSLSINGKVFTEQNIWKETLDACYRGVGPQAYGSNHSLQPVVTRAIRTEDSRSLIYDAQNAPTQYYTRSTDIPGFNNVADNLDNNGPFIERARIFQQDLSDDGKSWVGEISSYLEIGPFQARARLGNTAVPYIEDFHLQMDFVSQPSKFDQKCGLRFDSNPGNAERYMPPRLLEFATIPNYRPRGIEPIPASRYLNGVHFTWTAKPYLEVTYTKFPEPMRPGYQLRCFEHQYEQSLPRFVFDLEQNTSAHQPVPARITSRLLSYPTKIYLWGDQSDDTKGQFIDGGCRRSCQLKNIHCRINQRPSVIDAPSQENLFEMFQRHTNSDMEYGTWRKAPIYCFSPADLGQPDLHANDARLTWFEWDADVSLTDLQIREQQDKEYAAAMDQSGYELKFETAVWFPDYDSWPNGWISYKPSFSLDPVIQTRYNRTNNTPTVVVRHDWTADSDLKKAPMIPTKMATQIVGKTFVPSATQLNFSTDAPIPQISEMDITITGTTGITQQFQGLIFAKVNIQQGDAGYGQIDGGSIYWVPATTYLSDMANIAADGANIVNDFSQLRANVTYANQGGLVVDAYPAVDDPDTIVPWRGKYETEDQRYTNGDNIGTSWANRAQGTRRALPGPAAFRCMSAGMLNCNANRTAPAPPLKRGDGGYDEIDETTSNLRWCAFSVDQQIFDQATVGGHKQSHIAPIATQHDQSTGDNIWTGRGQQLIRFTTTAEYGRVTAANNTTGTAGDLQTNFYDFGGGANYGVGVVQQLPEFTMVHDERAKNIVPTEYQMKVLYEFGNCQYEFVRGAAPVRVKPNLIPVGPSPGLPQLE